MKISSIKVFTDLSFKDKILVAKIFVLSGIVRLAILSIPFGKIREHLGEYNRESSEEAELLGYKKAYHIRRLVNATTKYTPWESKCLVRAIVAQHLLKKEHIPTTLYLGVSKGENDTLNAHAWLRYGKMIVTGGEVKSAFKQVSCFSNDLFVNK